MNSNVMFMPHFNLSYLQTISKAMSFSPKFSDDSDSDEPVLEPRQATSRKRKANEDDDQATTMTPGPSPVPSVAPPPNYPQFEVDLPLELLERGWRKYWSRRESRAYFFNKETGETVWNQPEILPEPGKTGASASVKELRQKVVIISLFPQYAFKV